MEKNVKDADLEKVTGGEGDTPPLFNCWNCHKPFDYVTYRKCPNCFPENNRTDNPDDPNNGIGPAGK